MRADDVRDALRARFSDSRRYAVAEEVGLTTGHSHRRLDVMVLDCYASNGFRIDGIEIKVSKADLKRELVDPEKHVAFFDVIDYYTLACPKGVANLDLIPPKWGVMNVNEDGTTRYLRRPVALHDDRPPAVPRGFLASIVRAIQAKEPSAVALKAEYDRGRKDEKERAARERRFYRDRVELEAEKIKKYDELTRQLGIYGDQDEALHRFRQIQDLGFEWLIPSLKRNVKTMQEMIDKLEMPKEGK